jgi:hypothetical protein
MKLQEKFDFDAELKLIYMPVVFEKKQNNENTKLIS